MAVVFRNDIDLGKNEIQNAVVQNLASAPGSPVGGQLYYNTGDGNLYFYDAFGTQWVDTSASGSGTTNLSIANRGASTLDVASDTGTDATIPAATTSLTGLLTAADKTTLDNQSGTNTGDVTLNAAVTDILSVASQQLSAVDAGAADAIVGWDDSLAKLTYLSAADVRTAINVDVAGTDNSIDVTLAGTPDYLTLSGQQITLNQIDLTADVTGILPIGNFATIDDDTFATASATTVPTSESVKAYADGLLAAADAMTFQGGLDASGANQLPAGDAGDTYKITVAGDFNGTTETLSIGTMVVCTTDSTAANTPANWIFLEENLEAASTTVAGYVRLATGAETNTGTDATIAVTPDGLDDWTGSAQITTLGTIGTGTWQGTVIAEAYLPDASDAAQGVVELATIAETNTGTSTTLAVTPDGLDGWTGSAQVTTLGTIGTGTWQGDVIAEAYLPNAGEAAEGVVELATTTEAATGTDTTRAVTAAGLAAFEAAQGYATDIGDGASTGIAVTHNLGTRDVMVELYNNTSYDTEFCEVERNTTDQVTLRFNTAPTTNELRVLIRKVT